MHRRDLPFRAEVEGTNFRFNSFLMVVRGVVVVAKPARLVADVRRGSWIRFKVPGSDEHEIRMQVRNPNLIRLSGKQAFVCSMPTGFAAKSVRLAKRFNTIRYKNLHLVTGAHEPEFRIIDISASGCKVILPEHWLERRPRGGDEERGTGEEGEERPAAPEREAEGFPVGEPLPESLVRVGEKVQVALERLIPRVHLFAQGRLLVGFEWVVEATGDSRKFLHHLINELQKEEDARIKHQLF